MKRPARALLLLILASLLDAMAAGAAPATAPVPPSPPLARCQDDPSLVGACYVVHGRLNALGGGLYFGSTQYRIWRVGTHRLLGLSPEPTDDRYAQAPPLPALLADPRVRAVYADFTVCPSARCARSASPPPVTWWPSTAAKKVKPSVARRGGPSGSAYPLPEARSRGFVTRPSKPVPTSGIAWNAWPKERRNRLPASSRPSLSPSPTAWTKTPNQPVTFC